MHADPDPLKRSNLFWPLARRLQSRYGWGPPAGPPAGPAGHSIATQNPPEPARTKRSIIKNQCCGSMTFWGGSGSGSGSMPLTNFAFCRYMYIIFKDKKSKRSHKAVGIKVFLTFFCLVIEGSSSGSRSILMTDGSGSGSRRPKNIWIRLIRIRIRNTAKNYN